MKEVLVVDAKMTKRILVPGAADALADCCK